jgi:putative zinc finger protein
VNEHPHILLAEYVDGTLPGDDRARVDAHLLGCNRCREEVSLAEQARATLLALPEEPAPEGITFGVRSRARRSTSPRTARWVAAGAAAAVLVGGGIVVYRVFQGPEGRAISGAGGGELERAPGRGLQEAAPTEEAADSALAARPTVPTYTESDRDYTVPELVALGRDVRDRARRALADGLAAEAITFYETFDPGAFTRPVRRAIDCSLREVPPEQLPVPFSIEEASFQGEPAYVAAFLQGPAPDQPYDRVILWVVSRDSCSLRSLASQQL